MIKRTVALLLTVILLLALVPQTALAAPQLQVITVKSEKGTLAMTVYTNGYGDLLFSGEDIEDVTGYLYENDGKTATFTRGSKVIEVNLSNGKYTPLKGQSNMNPRESISEPYRVGEQWYFSAATLFPWLNLNCDVQGGKLELVPDAYSFWDVWGTMELGKYGVYYSDLIMEFEWDSKVVKAMQYTKDHVGEKLLEGVRYHDEYDGSVNDYYDLLECMLLDSTHSEYLADSIHDYAELGFNVAGIFAGDFGPIFTAFQVVNDGIYYASQYAAFTANHSDKMELIETMSLARGGYTAQLRDATLLIEKSYSSWWDNILTKYVLNLDKYLVDKIKDKAVSNPIGKAILLAVDVSTKEIQKLNTRIGLMAPLTNLYEEGLSHYAGGGTHYSDIRDRRTHAILGLFAAGENLRTLATYSEKHNRPDLSGKYTAMAKECDLWIKELTAASTAQMNDSHCYWEADGDDEGSKDIYSNKLLDLFESVDVYTPAPAGLELVEYAMLMDYTEQLPMAEKKWTLTGPDQSGRQGLVLYGGQKDRLFQFEAYVTNLHCRLYGSSSVPDAASPDLRVVNLSGDAATLLGKLDAYFAGRENFYRSQAADLNGDGAQDRLYVIPSSALMWLNRMEMVTSSVTREFFGNDSAITLVAAEAADTGLEVRVMRIPVPQNLEWTLEGGTLTVDGTVYRYTAEGEDPFYAEAPPVDTSGMALSKLLLQPYDEVTPLIRDYSELSWVDGETIYGKGTFNGTQLELRFEKFGDAYRLENLQALFGEATLPVTPKLTSADPLEEVKENLQPHFDWSWKDTKDEGDLLYSFYSNFHYDTGSKTVWYITLRTKTVYEEAGWTTPTWAGIEFSYDDKLTRDVPDWLLHGIG